MRLSIKLLIGSLTLLTACGGPPRPVFAVVAEVKAKRIELASGQRASVLTTENRSFSVNPKTKAEVIVLGPKDEGGGRPAKAMKISIQEFASDCLAKNPCLLDQIASNTIQVGMQSRDGSNGFEAIVISTAAAGAFGAVCISGICGEALQEASGPLLIGAGVMAVFVLALAFAR